MLARARRRGSTLRCENSDGKPCSGVRGDHEVSTAQQTRQDHAVPVREAVFLCFAALVRYEQGAALSRSDS